MFSKLIQKLRNSAPLRSLLQGHFFTSIPLLYRIGHFYSPIVHPKDATLRAAHLWKRQDEMAGIDLRLQAQLELLRQLAVHTESIDYPVSKPRAGVGYFYSNDQFPALDAEFLHTVQCHVSHKTMIEFGSGFSSLITAHVNQKILNIFWPDEYPKVSVTDHGRNCNEKCSLRDFMQYNADWAVVWAAHFIGARHTNVVQEVFPRYPGVCGGGSFWIRRK